MRKTLQLEVLFLLLLLLLGSILNAQIFTRLTVDEETHFRRASWVDYDNDGDLDLFFGIINGANTSDTHNKIFRNDGNDTFTDVTPSSMLNRNTFTIGLTWGDYNNDGNIDLFASNVNATLNTSLGSNLLKNQGDGNLELVTAGDIGMTNTVAAFGSGWADYDNDGDLDLFATTPAGSAYPGDTLSNVLFDNNGDETFTRNLNSAIVNDDPHIYNVPTWSDYDQDGDMDLYVARGLANGTFIPDFFYINMLQETGSANFVKDTQSAFATDTHDGLDAKFIDYDNDGDLDVHIINWGGAPPASPPTWPGAPNELYRNDGNGVYTKITAGSIVTDIDISTTQVWGDYDNDGDLDLYVCNNTSAVQLGGNRYYRNEGFPNYNFTRLSLGDFTVNSRASQGAATGDYDNDGDLDVYVVLQTLFGSAAVDALYRNDTNNGNTWIKIIGQGVVSNRSAIGAKVRAKATIFGNSYWQMREIAVNQSLGCQSSLIAHFGFGDAAVVDSLLVEWPSGMIDVYENVAVNQHYTAVEGQTITSIKDGPGNTTITAQFDLQQNYPNPFNPSTAITYSLSKSTLVGLQYTG